ncbi:unnamed protein product [Phytophthora lilii]|uniref:Unnamed protein product n=1 Tax=Phytophthora lilii TaxID=2077276 RepID=A0A9W6WQ74_9STRA|nr:unnamed protein product [Phytophthora lilii]
MVNCHFNLPWTQVSSDLLSFENWTRRRVIDMVSFYAVTGGRRSGIFTSFEQVQDATVGFPGAKFAKFLTLAEAEAFVKKEKQRVKALAGWSGPAYAVAVGRRMGVFKTQQEALKQTLYYSGNSLKRFDSYGEAVEFLDKHNWRAMSAGGEWENPDASDLSTQLSDTDSALDEQNPQDSDTSSSVATRKRERDGNELADKLPPSQRRRTDIDDAPIENLEYMVVETGLDETSEVRV